MPTRNSQYRADCLRWLIVAIALISLPLCACRAEEELLRLLDQSPFDRITLKAEAGGETIDTTLLDFPNRQVPSPLPIEGELQLQRLVDPTVQYLVPWTAVAKIETYEQLLYAETLQLIAANEFAEAFAYLQFLHKNYPNLKGLSTATENYLKREAFYSFSQKRYDDAISILTALHDLNPQHRGLATAVDTVIEKIIKSHLAAKDFAAARRLLDSAHAAFPKLQLKTIAIWRKKFQDAANRQLQSAQRLLKNKKYQEARQALRHAVAILPDAPNIKEMFAELDRLAPQVIVGVTRHGPTMLGNPLADMSALRVSRLVNPKFIEMVDFGSEGAIYASPWANLSTDDTGLQFNVQLNANAARDGIQPDILARQILQLARLSNSNRQPTLAGLLDSVSITDGQQISLHLDHPHVRPSALLPLPARDLTPGDIPPGAYQATSKDSNKNLLRYEALGQRNNQKLKPSILEKIFTSEEIALTALLAGDIDLLERVAPWQIDRIRNDRQITIAEYRLPTVHVLLPNYSKPLLRRREFRRALCYGIDRLQIVNEIILGGSSHPGFRVLSGPLPAGSSITDPLGFGYKQEVLPRPYEPRLAAVLAAVARSSVMQSGTDSKSTAEPEVDLQSTADPQSEESESEDSEIEAIILAYPPDFVAQTTCHAIKKQLDAVGIPIKLLQLSPYLTEEPADYDLLYTELAIWEPLTDLQQLLGPRGIAGRCSPSMSLALDAVDQARNWQETRTRLRDLHEVAFYDLPVIPLWQTKNSFAYHKTLQGISESPISLYQDVANWKISSLGAE